MVEPRTFCCEVMHEYERQWSLAAGHAVRHPLHLKIERLKRWCEESASPDAFEEQLDRAERSDDPGEALLASELRPIWLSARSGGPLPFASGNC